MAIPAGVDAETNEQLLRNSRSRFLWKALRHIPLAAWVTTQHALGISEQSQHVDFRTRLLVGVGQSFASGQDPTASVLQTQAASLRDNGIPAGTWISKYTSPVPPESGAVDAVMAGVRGMVRLDPEAMKRTRTPGYIPVEAEWTAYRPSETRGEGLPDITEKEKYSEMMKDVKDETTVLYLHGGGYTMLDPASHRPTVRQLCKRTGGRGYSVRYRLSPQAVFPAALLDAFVSYLTLLYPPPDAYHEPVKAEHIVFSGDSAGGNLVMSLLQLLLELRRQNTKVLWHGEERAIPLPAGAACNSPWLDVTHSLVPYGGDRPAKYDLLPTPTPALGWMAKKRVDAVWPATPARHNFYADDHLVAHPLVSMIGTRPEDWEGSPPIFLCAGWEQLGTEDRVFARRLATKTEVPVVFNDYEAMPHCFAMILAHSATAEHCWAAWSGFVKACVNTPGEIRSKATVVKAGTLEEVDASFETLVDFTDEEAQEIFMKQNQSPFKVSPRL